MQRCPHFGSVAPAVYKLTVRPLPARGTEEVRQATSQLASLYAGMEHRFVHVCILSRRKSFLGCERKLLTWLQSAVIGALAIAIKEPARLPGRAGRGHAHMDAGHCSDIGTLGLVAGDFEDGVLSQGRAVNLINMKKPHRVL